MKIRMKCPKCQFENREGIKFCEECGAKRECISTAIELFQQCEIEIYLRQAKEALASLE